jgi:hypothetical protein
MSKILASSWQVLQEPSLQTISKNAHINVLDRFSVLRSVCATVCVKWLTHVLEANPFFTLFAFVI